MKRPPPGKKSSGSGQDGTGSGSAPPAKITRTSGATSEGGPAPTGTPPATGSGSGPAPQGAEDWAMTPDLSTAMGLGPDTATPTGTPGAPTAAPPPTPTGRHETTAYGEYWVVPDSTTAPVQGAQGEQITESVFNRLKALWDRINAGSGKIKVIETDSAGKAHGGFKASIIAKLGKLMSHPHGRRLVTELDDGGFNVTIKPSPGKLLGGGSTSTTSDALEKTGGAAGKGAASTIEIDPAVTDTDIKVYDSGGNQISDPVYIFLGHEMIHAHHNQRGHNQTRQAATDAAYGNAEEQQTISTGGINENMLRSENGLDARVGHAGTDTRP